MADEILINNVELSVVDAITTVYTSPSNGEGTIINAFSATNNGEASATYKAYIYDQTGSEVSATVPLTIVVRDTVHCAPSLINKKISAGGTIRVETSTANFINFNATGLEL